MHPGTWKSLNDPKLPMKGPKNFLLRKLRAEGSQLPSNRWLVKRRGHFFPIYSQQEPRARSNPKPMQGNLTGSSKETSRKDKPNLSQGTLRPGGFFPREKKGFPEKNDICLVRRDYGGTHQKWGGEGWSPPISPQEPTQPNPIQIRTNQREAGLTCFLGDPHPKKRIEATFKKKKKGKQKKTLIFDLWAPDRGGVLASDSDSTTIKGRRGELQVKEAS